MAVMPRALALTVKHRGEIVTMDMACQPTEVPEDIDIDAIRAKYAHERDKRVRKEGEAQYVEVSDEFSDYYERAPWTAPVVRDPISDDIDVAILGGGFAGPVMMVAVQNSVAVRDLGTGTSGQPIATQTQLLVPTETGLLVLQQADGQPDPRFEFQSQGPKLEQKVLSVAKWRDQLFLNVGYAWTDYRWPPRTYMEVENRVALWVPESPPPTPKAPQ